MYIPSGAIAVHSCALAHRLNTRSAAIDLPWPIVFYGLDAHVSEFISKVCKKTEGVHFSNERID